MALTDHESFLGKRTGPGEWEYLQRVAERYDEPGSFATLYAYEWTGKMYPGPGHKCVYFPRRGVPLVSRDDVPEGSELVQRVQELGGFSSPHHIGWTGADEPGHDDQGQPALGDLLLPRLLRARRSSAWRARRATRADGRRDVAARPPLWLHRLVR